MGKKITLKEFFEGNKIAIHCDTHEKAKKLLSEFDKLGKSWRSGASYLKYDFWDDFKEFTCYGNSGEFGSVGTYSDKGCTIYEFEDVLLAISKPKFNVGDYVIAHDGLCIVYDVEVNIPNIVLYELKAVNSIFTFGKVLESNIRKPTLKELLGTKQNIVFKINGDEERTKLFKALDELNILWMSGDRALTFLHEYVVGPYVLEWHSGINQYRLVCGEDGVIIIDSLDMLLDFEQNDKDVSSIGFDFYTNGFLSELLTRGHDYYSEGTSAFAIKTYLEGEDKMVKIENIYVNEKKRTIVVKWYSGETTKVTCAPDDTWDLEKGVAMAIAKYYLGNDYHAGDLFQRYLKKATISASKNTDTKKKTSKNKKASS